MVLHHLSLVNIKIPKNIGEYCRIKYNNIWVYRFIFYFCPPVIGTYFTNTRAQPVSNGMRGVLLALWSQPAAVETNCVWNRTQGMAVICLGVESVVTTLKKITALFTSQWGPSLTFYTFIKNTKTGKTDGWLNEVTWLCQTSAERKNGVDGAYLC